MKTAAIGALASLACSEAFSLSKTAFLPQNLAASFQLSSSRWVMYDASQEQRGQKSPSQNSDVVWSSLANTEKWIQKTLAGPQGDTFARKEVSYVCETSSTVEEIVAGLFRRLREMREIGANHGAEEGKIRRVQGSKYIARTHRQTLVVVAPSNKEITKSFAVFDSVIQAINDARRNARDYFTDYEYEKLAAEDDGAKTQDWVTSVNLSHMHPDFGVYEDTLGENKEYDADTKEYISRRMTTRRSPYPSAVIEMRSIPPFEIPNKPPPRRIKDDDAKFSINEVKRLEVLFGNAVSFADDDANNEATVASSPEEDLWSKLSHSMEIEEVSVLSPADQGQQWIIQNDQQYCPDWSSFTSYDTQHVDSAYEFVFSTIAFQRNRAMAAAAKPYQTGYTAWKLTQQDPDVLRLKRDYLLMPQFLTRAATSFEKFSEQVQQIVDVIPTVSDYLTITTFHPEHVHKDKRSPVPVIVLEWIPEDA